MSILNTKYHAPLLKDLQHICEVAGGEEATDLMDTDMIDTDSYSRTDALSGHLFPQNKRRRAQDHGNGQTRKPIELFKSIVCQSIAFLGSGSV